MLDRKIAEEPDDATRSGWQRFKTAITGAATDIGTGTVAGVLVEVARAVAR